MMVDVVSFEESVGVLVVAIALGGCGERRMRESVGEKVEPIGNGWWSVLFGLDVLCFWSSGGVGVESVCAESEGLRAWWYEVRRYAHGGCEWLSFVAFSVDVVYEIWIAGSSGGCVWWCGSVTVVRKCVVAIPGVVALMNGDVCGGVFVLADV